VSDGEDISIFPPQEMMLVCKGCGGERVIPQAELDKIRSVDDFERFTKGRIAIYSCRCGARKCDIRMLPNPAAIPYLKEAVAKKDGVS
jgi:hypothetical protein